MTYVEITGFLLPEIVLLLAALGALTTGLAGERADTRLPGVLALGGIAIAAAVLLLFPREGELAGGMLVRGGLEDLFRLVLLGLSFASGLLLFEAPPERHRGENWALLLFATIGMLLLVGTENLLMIFLALELTSLSLYLLVGFAKTDIRSVEAALKYFLLGGVSAANLLFGFSWLYGLSGTLSLVEIGSALAETGTGPAVVVAMGMALAGFAFKVAAVPFHFWAADVYQGAPIPAGALIASGSKVAGFFVLAKVLLIGFAGVEGSAGWAALGAGWAPLLAAGAALSMTAGNLAALVQKNSVRRLLAFSAIGHAGFLLLGLLGASPASLASVLFYVVIYAIAALGAFGVVGVVLKRRGGDSLDNFAGLGREAPGLSFCLLLFLVSLAGLPPLAGFFGKFYLFTAAMGRAGAVDAAPGLLWLVTLALFMSAVSLYYYLLVLKQVYLGKAPAGEGSDVRASTPVLTGFSCALLAAVLVLLGCFPDLLLGPITAAISAGR